MTTARQWLDGARPRTLPLAVAPVLGAAAVVPRGDVDAVVLVMCAAVALALQVGVNYANDYSDGIRGTDAERATTGGPIRLVGQGLAAAGSVKRAAWLSFALACVFGAAVVAAAGDWRLLLVGAAAVPAAWFYTGGSRPYGYAGLGEVFVFTFFGLVAVLGTVYAHVGSLPAQAWLLAAGEGLLASAVLMVNNLRDIPTDRVNGKHTLAVRLGDRRSRYAYCAMVALGLAFVVVGVLPSLAVVAGWTLTAVALAAALLLSRKALSGIVGRALVPLLAATSRVALAVSALAFLLTVVAGP